MVNPWIEILLDAEVAENAQKSVISSVEAMTGCGVEAVNIHVCGVTLD